MAWMLIAIALFAVSGVSALGFPRTSRTGDRWFALLMVTGGLIGFSGAMATLINNTEATVSMAWPMLIPGWGRVVIHVDALSAAFLLPVFAIPALGAVYASAYWSEQASSRPWAAQRLRMFYGTLAASMALVILARDGVLF